MEGESQTGQEWFPLQSLVEMLTVMGVPQFANFPVVVYFL